ncbi:hypothetical protein DASC09_025940 [Saccharomycopsis crataegensis]|uniref:Peptidase A1 domain-containing protein n=1 Tax=Saccharomycopsis crataegensis TaxID=43959 RepID=A0AAV5QKW4_9ASCO|nr:hypothetical protein DASC09_025940 [Saccharomycopsis crataegensis]
MKSTFFAFPRFYRAVLLLSLTARLAFSFSAHSDNSSIIVGDSLDLLYVKDSLNYLNVTVNGEVQSLLFELNSPIVWYYSSQDSSADYQEFIIEYTEDIKILGEYTNSNNITIATNISLNNQSLGIIDSQGDMEELFDIAQNGTDNFLNGVFGHSYFNPVLKSLNSTGATGATDTNGNFTAKQSYRNNFLVMFFNINDRIQVNSNPSPSYVTGCVVYGDVDFQLINSDVYFTSVLPNSEYFWLIGISTISYFDLGNDNDISSRIIFDNSITLDDGAIIPNNSRVAVFDLSITSTDEDDSILLMAPFADAHKLHSEMFGNDSFSYDDSSNSFLIDCNETRVLQLNIGGNAWNITSSDYVGSAFGSKCVSNIKSYGDESNTKNQTFLIYNYPKLINSQYWVLGSKFFSKITLVFDIDESLVGLSTRDSLETINFITDETLLEQLFKNETGLAYLSDTGNMSSMPFTTISNIFTESISLNYGSDYATTVLESRIIFGTIASSSSSTSSKSFGESLRSKNVVSSTSHKWILLACSMLVPFITLLFF